MPNIKSAKKRVRVNATKAAANKARKSNLKTMIKKADLACTENAADKEAAIRVAIKKVDQACAKGLLHKNAAARKKSQRAKKRNAAEEDARFLKKANRMLSGRHAVFCYLNRFFMRQTACFCLHFSAFCGMMNSSVPFYLAHHFAYLFKRD